MKISALIWVMSFFASAVIAQDSALQKKWDFNGYMKDLNSFTIPTQFSDFQYTQLVHNRLNFKWMPDDKFTAALELRNRFFWGDAVTSDPHFNQNLRNANEAVNMSVIWFNTGTAALQTNVERLWGEYRKGKWNLRAGRQRINWGVANAWNPNDIFNSYNILDFDYEERPGADAVKLRYSLDDMSHIETAAAVTDSGRNGIMALKYSTHRGEYDWQLITGLYKRRFTAGAGWSGNLGGAGFKGEVQAFFPDKDSGFVINATTEVDYITRNGWYLSGGILFNQQGLTGPVQDWKTLTFKNTPDNLIPAQWNILASTSKALTPILNGSFTAIYCPLVNMLVLFPSLSYNVAANVDLSLFWQSLFAENANKFMSVTHVGYLRVKWSF